jgi:hypothetical protein
MSRTCYSRMGIGVLSITLCLVIVFLCTPVCSHNAPHECMQNAATVAPGESSPGSQCRGPELTTSDGKSICLSCHHKPKHGSAKKIHRKHNDMTCCDCHVPTPN